MVGMVYLVGAGPGDPELLTLKGKRCLESADVVLYDRLISPAVLKWIPERATAIDVGKTPANHRYRQDQINQLLIEYASSGKTVVRLKGGDPFVFGRGAEELEALAAHDMPFEVVPGVSSAIAVPAAAGIPVTVRGQAGGFHVVTGHEAVTSGGVDWNFLGQSRETLVILMGMQHLETISTRLKAAGRPPETPVAVVSHGTRPEQSVAVGTLETIVPTAEQAKVTAPAVIVVGDVVGWARERGFVVGTGRNR
mgnify:CR=1 FL=1